MSKILFVKSKSTPDVPGFNDEIVIVVDNNPVFHLPMSACPNEKKPVPGALYKDWLVPWDKYYSWVACTPTDQPLNWEYTKTEKHPDGCLLFNKGGAVSTRNPNPNQEDRKVAFSVEIHPSDSELWRGSKACFTVKKSLWPSFISLFTLGEKGLLYIIDYSKMGVQDDTIISSFSK
jgi:hypothetical protein